MTIDQNKYDGTSNDKNSATFQKSTEKEILAQFRQIDTDNNGSITFPEFYKYMNDHKIPLSDTYIKELNEFIDTDKNGLISKKEFIYFYLKREEDLFHSYQTLIDAINSQQNAAANTTNNVNKSTASPPPSTTTTAPNPSITTKPNTPSSNNKAVVTDPCAQPPTPPPHSPPLSFPKPPAHTHKLNAATLREALLLLHIKASDEEIRTFITNIDANNDGHISFQEYLHFLLLLPTGSNPRATFDQFRNIYSAVDYGGSPEYQSPVEKPISTTSALPYNNNGSTNQDLFDDLKTTFTLTFSLSKSTILLLNGGIAGIISRTGTAPIDRLKTIMQAGIVPSSSSSSGSSSNNTAAVITSKSATVNAVSLTPASATASSTTTASTTINNTVNSNAIHNTVINNATTHRPKGLIQVAKEIYKKDGIRSFYRGNGVNCLKVAPETSIKMYSFELLKSYIAFDANAISAQERFLAGGLAGALSQSLIYPLEIVKTRLALSSPGVYKSILHCFMSIGRKDGIKGYYKGLSTSVVGIIPYAGIDLMTNSLFKEFLIKTYCTQNINNNSTVNTIYSITSIGSNRNNGNSSMKTGDDKNSNNMSNNTKINNTSNNKVVLPSQTEPSMLLLLFNGMVSSTVAMTLTYPIGLLRTRLQASGMPDRPVYHGTFDAAVKIYSQEGVRGFFRGFVPNLLKVVPAASLSYGVYDFLNKQLLPSASSLSSSTTK